MAEDSDSKLNGVIREQSFTAPEPVSTKSNDDTVSKKPNCIPFPEEEEEEEEEGNVSLNGGLSQKGQKVVCGVADITKKDERLGHHHKDEDREEGSVKCALKIEVIDDTALIGPANIGDISQRKGKAAVGFAEHFGTNAINKRNVVQERGRNGKQIAGFEGMIEWSGNCERYLGQDCVGNGKRIAGHDGNLMRNENEKGFVGFAGNLHTNGNDKRNLIQESGGIEKTVIQESEGKKEKRPRKRGNKNDGKKKSDEKENVSISIHGDTVRVSREKKMCYSRKEMEALRFVDVEEQKKRWAEVYCGLGPEIVKEYNGLVDSDNQKQKQFLLDFDPRRQFGYQRDSSFYEEECDDNDDTDDDYDGILKPAFAIAGEPDFDSGPPQDGLEYLRRVRWEASRIPKVTVSRVDKSKLNREQTPYMPKIPEIAKCPENLLPLKQWEDAFLADFSELRLALSKFESSTNNIPGKQPTVSVTSEQESTLELSSTIVESFEELTAGENSVKSSDISLRDILNNQETVSDIYENDDLDTLECSSDRQTVKENIESYPSMSTVLRLDSVDRVSMLRRRISSLENVSSLSKDDCLWLFALCAAIDTPLDADTCASFRSLLRKCANLRAQKAELDDEVIMLNILATISGRYFGQSEN